MLHVQIPLIPSHLLHRGDLGARVTTSWLIMATLSQRDIDNIISADTEKSHGVLLTWKERERERGGGGERGGGQEEGGGGWREVGRKRQRDTDRH